LSTGLSLPDELYDLRYDRQEQDVEGQQYQGASDIARINVSAHQIFF
jgi:hypothetical protein